MAIILSPKRLQIDKTNANVVTVVIVASVLSVFFLVASYSLNSKRSYQQKVVNVKQKAVKQLKANIEAVKTLAVSYKDFTSKDPNILGGNPNGTGEKDGDNAKITLDSLPSKYDFPALATSLEKLLTQKNFTVVSITGTDDEIAQISSNSTQPVEIPFSISVQSNAQNISELIKTLENSIRPLKIEKITLSGSDENLTIKINAKTYYLPGKKLDVRKEVVK